MSTYDASLDYRSTASARPVTEQPKEDENEFNEIYSLEEINFVAPSAFARFREGHPGFLWFLAVNIVVAPLLAYAGLQIVESHAPSVSNAIMMSSGIQSLTAAELVDYVRLGHGTAYWLDAAAGDKYTIDSSHNGVNLISYLPAGATPSGPNHATLNIKTYRDITVYNSQLRPLSSSENAQVVTPYGAIVQYNASSPNHMIVSFRDRPEIVAVDYPSVQTPTSFIQDADRLIPIK